MSALGWIKDSFSTTQFENFLLLPVAKQNIDGYYWASIFDAIGETYKTYSDAVDKVLDSTGP